MGILGRAVIITLFAKGLLAQTFGVTVRYSPEPMAVPASVLANARDMGRWAVMMCNDGGTAVTLPYERVAMAAGAISFIPMDDAMLVLNGHAKRTTSAKVVNVLAWVGRGGAIALAIASRSNYAWSTGVGIGASLLPDVVTVIQGNINPPTAVPLTSPLKWPIVLPGNGCATDFWFAAKMKAPKPYTAKL